MTLLILYVAFALGVSFVCSLLEATLLASRKATLAGMEAAGSRGAGILLEIKKERGDDAISSILILNTAANTLGATMAGAQAAKVFGNAWIGAFSGLLTFLILVFSEIIPKTLGAYYWNRFAGLAGRVLAVLLGLAAPALVISRKLTSFLTRGDSAGMSRGDLEHLINAAGDEGAISTIESTMVRNLLRFQDIHVEDVMTPRTVTIMMTADSTIDELLANDEAEAFSRIPLYEGTRDNVVGYVLQRDILKAVGEGCERNRPLSDFRREVWFVPEFATIAAALSQILERHEPIAMAVDEHGGIAGLVTLEDLAETMLGVEIVDESDQVVDMRRKAAELRDRRMERTHRHR